MVDYPIYQSKPDSVSESITRYGVGFPYIHNVYDQVNEIDRATQEVRPKLNSEGERIFHFTYHHDKQRLE